MPGLVNHTFLELCVLLGSLHSGLEESSYSSTDPAHSHLSTLREKIEVEAVALIETLASGVDYPLPMAMQSRSRAVLSAVPETDEAATIDDGSYATFLSWAGAEDLRLAAARGLRLGPRLGDLLALAQRDPEIEDVVFGPLARSGVMMNGPYPAWAHMSKIWNLGEIDQIVRLLKLHIELFPGEMSEALYHRASCNDSAGAEILFVAGARPIEGRPLIPEDTIFEPRGFLQRAKSNHGLMATLNGPAPADLIAEFRRAYIPF